MKDEKTLNCSDIQPSVSRRGFIKWSSFLGGALAASGSVACFFS